VERLIFIRKAKNLGFSLSDVGDTLALYDTRQAPCVHVLALLDRKIQEIDRLMGELKELQQELMRLREESAARVEQDAQEGTICAIVDRGVHTRGEVALSWLESVRKRGK